MTASHQREHPGDKQHWLFTVSATRGYNGGHAAFLLVTLAVLVWLPLPLGSVTAFGWPGLALSLLAGCLLYAWRYPIHARQIARQQRYFLVVWVILVSWHGVFLLLLPYDWETVLRPYQAFFTTAGLALALLTCALVIGLGLVVWLGIYWLKSAFGMHRVAG